MAVRPDCCSQKPLGDETSTDNAEASPGRLRVRLPGRKRLGLRQVNNGGRYAKPLGATRDSLTAPARYEGSIMRENSTHSVPNQRFSCDQGSAITLDDTQANDKLFIKTRNSEYRFQIADPLTHKGLLSGGALGEEPREAYLIESLCRGEDGKVQVCSGLNTGARALFYCSSGHRIERVTTSEISSLILVKGEESEKRGDLPSKTD